MVSITIRLIGYGLAISLMVKEEDILQAYEYLGYTPRDQQIEVITNVLTEYIVNKKKNVVLCLDTGAGKSIIAAVIARCMQVYGEIELSSIIMTHQNSLATQYHNSFAKLGNETFLPIKGAGTYPCNFATKKTGMKSSAEECQRDKLSPVELNTFCKDCEFRETRKLLNKSDNIITNYAYFFIAKLMSTNLKPRNMHIYDEAHIINEVYSEHMSIFVSVQRLDAYITEINAESNIAFQSEVQELENIKLSVINNKVTEDNYHDILSRYGKTLNSIHQRFESMSEAQDNLAMKLVLFKKYRKYYNLAGKVSDFFSYNYEHVFDSVVPNEFTVKPIFIKDIIHELLAKYNLFMSATITQDFAEETMGLHEETTAFVTAAPSFPKENRPIFFMGSNVLNYSNLQLESTITDINKMVSKVLKFHHDDKGIILTPSFAMNEKIAKSIKENVKIFEHVRGENAAQLIDRFKQYDKPAVLISPSLYEGLDLDGDSSRYQIIVKTPYASLKEKRIEYITKHYPDIYKTMTLYKVLQGIGRSIRSMEDYAATYCIDKNLSYLFNSKFNIWKSRYNVLLK